MSLPAKLLAVLLACLACLAFGWRMGTHSKQAEWDEANAQATRETLAAERKAADFNRVAAASRAASAVVADQAARERAQRIDHATEVPAPAVCAVPDGVRDDLAAAIDAANAAR